MTDIMTETVLGCLKLYSKCWCLTRPWTIFMSISFIAMLHMGKGDHYRTAEANMRNSTSLICNQYEFRGIIEAALSCHMNSLCRAVLEETIGNDHLALCQCMKEDEHFSSIYDLNIFLKVNRTFGTGRNYWLRYGNMANNYQKMLRPHQIINLFWFH